MFLLVWTEVHESKGPEPTYEDHWFAHETYMECQEQYNRLLQLEEVYSASICTVLKSTDYEGVELDV
jgi:hypothetical protein